MRNTKDKGRERKLEGYDEDHKDGRDRDSDLIYAYVLLGLYMSISFILAVGIIVAPWAASKHADGMAASLYNFYSHLCHQYPERSLCYFPNASSALNTIQSCINKSTINYVETKYTHKHIGKSIGKRSNPYAYLENYSGIFIFNKSQVGYLRAEIVERNGLKGYKFAVCARDTGFYWGMLLAALAYIIWLAAQKGEKRIVRFSSALFLLLVLPLIIDGTAQLFTSWESTNAIRLITGFLAGTAVSLAFVPGIILTFKEEDRDCKMKVKAKIMGSP